MYLTTNDYIIYGCALVVGFGAYVFIWDKSKILAGSIIAAIVGYFLYTFVNWEAVDLYFKVPWKLP